MSRLCGRRSRSSSLRETWSASQTRWRRFSTSTAGGAQNLRGGGGGGGGAAHRGAPGGQRRRQRRRDLALELLVEVGEGEVAAEDEVEGAVGGAGADVVAEERDAPGDLRADPPPRPPAADAARGAASLAGRGGRVRPPPGGAAGAPGPRPRAESRQDIACQHL